MISNQTLSDRAAKDTIGLHPVLQLLGESVGEFCVSPASGKLSARQAVFDLVGSCNLSSTTLPPLVGLFTMFLGVTFLAALTPGLAVMLVTSYSLDRGLGRAWQATLGIEVGNAVFVLASATGLTALLMACAPLFTVVRAVRCGLSHLPRGYAADFGVPIDSCRGENAPDKKSPSNSARAYDTAR